MILDRERKLPFPSLWTCWNAALAGVERSASIPSVRAIIINRWHKGDEEVLKGVQKDIQRPCSSALLAQRFPYASAAVNLGIAAIARESQTTSSAAAIAQIAAQLAGLDVVPITKEKARLAGSFPSKR